LRYCERVSCAEAVTRGPSFAEIRARCSGDKVSLAETSKDASTRDAVTLAC
jgi:hypothetical protein